MKIITNYDEISINGKSAVALGSFDGLHVGHVRVIEDMIKNGREKGLNTIVYTFANHPKEIIMPGKEPAKIIEIEEKIQLFNNFDLDYLCLIDFNDFLLNMEPEDFITELLIKKLNIQHLTVGYDYHFGKKARGDLDMIQAYSKEYGFEYSIISPVLVDGYRVSSTLIRQLLKEGEIEEANKFLGRTHFVKGTVIKGKHLGHTLGFPTANLKIKKNMSSIKPGVYITKTLLKKKIYNSLTNVGFNPTFKQVKLNLETYIIGVDEELYGEEIEVFFLKHIRDEMTFESIEELKVQMTLDLEYALDYFDHM